MRDAAQNRCGTLRARCGDHDEVAEPLEQVFDEATWILARLHDAVDGAERARGVPGGDGVDDLVEQRGVRVAEQSNRALVVDRVVVGPGHQLVEQRQGVAWRASAGAHDEREHPGCDRDPLGVAETLHILEHLRRRHEPERIVVRA